MSWPAPRTRPKTPLRGEVRHAGGFHSRELMALAAEARRLAGSRSARIKPKRVSHCILWRDQPFYWGKKGYYRRGSGDRRPLHHIIWEAHHGRRMPPKHEVIFLDEDPHNFEIHNLEMLHKSEVHLRIFEQGKLINPHIRTAPARLAQLMKRFNRKEPHEALRTLARRRHQDCPQSYR